jgi:hypothetical protein
MDTLTYYTDPDYGWLELPTAEALRLGILDSVSRYSYQSNDGATLYLEEDRDAMLYFDALKARGEANPQIREVNEAHGDSFVRSLPRIGPVGSLGIEVNQTANRKPQTANRKPQTANRKARGIEVNQTEQTKPKDGD